MLSMSGIISHVLHFFPTLSIYEGIICMLSEAVDFYSFLMIFL